MNMQQLIFEGKYPSLATSQQRQDSCRDHKDGHTLLSRELDHHL